MFDLKELREFCFCDGQDQADARKCMACEAADEIERLRAALEDAVDTLEVMDLHIDNPLYGRLRSALEQEVSKS